jgi:VCBS repeat-containing protein
MSPGRTKLVLVGAVLAIVASMALVALAAPSPRTLRLACASDVLGAKRLLHYAARASECRARGATLVRFGQRRAPVSACRKGSPAPGGGAGRRSPFGARARGPAGLLRLVSGADACKRAARLRETPLTLPAARALTFCVARRSRELRLVRSRGACRRTEFAARLPRRAAPPQPTGTTTAAATTTTVNRAPVANPDTASTSETSATSIAVLANDTDADGNPLTVASVDTTGTRGKVTIGSNGAIAYDPNHAFDTLTSSDTAHDTFRYTASDGQAQSNAATVDVTVTGASTPPKLTTTAGATAYTEGAAAVAVDAGLTVTDPDSANVAAATVRISAGFQAGDQLDFAAQNGIAGSYDAATGVLELSGSASKASYQAALRSIRYRSGTNRNPSAAKTVEFKARGTTVVSAPATKQLAITAVNEPPALTGGGGSAAYAEGSAPVQADPAITVADGDSTQLQRATASISAGFSAADGDRLAFTPANGITGSYAPTTGVLTLTGNASPASYQAALRSVTFSLTSNNPSTATRTVSFRATDSSGALSNVTTRGVGVSATDDAPAVTTTAGSTAYTQGAAATAVDGGATASDVDSATLASARVRIAGGLQSGDELQFTAQSGITGSYSAATGVLSLSGSASPASYQAALRTVRFRTTSSPLTPARSVELIVNDGLLDSPPATKQVTVTAVASGPTIAASGGSASYGEGAAPVQADPAITVSEPGSTLLKGATVAIASNFSGASGDRLAFTPANGITGTYDTGTGVLTLTGSASAASYQAALRSVTFSLTSDNPSTATRTVSFQAIDSADVSSNVATRNVGVSAVNDPPGVATSSGSTAYTEGAAATPIDAAATVSDPDNTSLATAQVRIASGFQAGDALVFAAQNGIAGSYNAATGVLALSGSASKASYQAALRSVRYGSGTNDNPAAAKTVEFKVGDGSLTSAPATKQIALTPVNDAPALATSGGSAAYTQGSAPVQPDPALTLSDPDSAQITGATVSITTNFTPADGDTLGFTAANGISAAYSASTGVLTLSGAASPASYQAALRSVTFSLTSQSPSTATRTVAFRATDSSGAQSNVATRNVTVADTTPADPLDAAIAHDLTFAASQLNRTLTETPSGEYPQETASDGTWDNYSAGWWTSGFFPGNLWLMYQATGDAAWRTAAQTRQAGLESQKTRTDTHDLGFMLFDSFGNGYRLTGTTAYRDVALTAAQSLATRYSAVVHAVRSWNNPSGAPASDFRVIVDNMMNLELLWWASKHGGDPALADKALQHALTTAAQHVRPDGSTYHLVIFDAGTGAVKSKQTVQGYSDSSTWARGQAWAVYGFTMAYRESGDSRMLDTARRVADYYVDHLPADRVPYWDFQAPGIPNEPRDSSAAAIAASGLIELSQLETDATRSARYLSTARATLTSLSSSAYLAEGTSSRSILLHGTANKPGGHYDRGLIYGDYFFLEALLRYRALP